MKVPAGLDWWRASPEGAAWLARLPEHVEACAERWSLTVGEPLTGGNVAFDAASLLRDRRWLLGPEDDRRRIERRLDLLVEITGVDRERMRLWGVVHALAWGVAGTTVEHDMVRCAELLAGA